MTADSDEDVELAGRAAIADRIRDEVEWLRRCAGWLGTLEAGVHPPVVDLRPAADWPDTANVVVNLSRVRAVIDRVAGDLGRETGEVGYSTIGYSPAGSIDQMPAPWRSAMSMAYTWHAK